jgi:hypothetical protein
MLQGNTISIITHIDSPNKNTDLNPLLRSVFSKIPTFKGVYVSTLRGLDVLEV